jgi:tetratricopeptide (TPR) repeat protein
MFEPKPIIHRIFLGAILLLASSCAHPPQPPDTGDARNSGSVKQAKSYLSSGNYKKALDVYAAALDRHPDSEALLDAYTKALESIKEDADKAYENQDYAKAGEIYRTLLKCGFGKRPQLGELTFDDDYLTMRIGACSKMLIEHGIMKYRTGDLEQAIAIWKKILVFNPSDREAKTAIDRATVQLQNLKQMK